MNLSKETIQSWPGVGIKKQFDIESFKQSILSELESEQNASETQDETSESVIDAETFLKKRFELENMDNMIHERIFNKSYLPDEIIGILEQFYHKRWRPSKPLFDTTFAGMTFNEAAWDLLDSDEK